MKHVLQENMRRFGTKNLPESQNITSRINTRTIEFEDIDPKDYPDFADAYISYAEFEDGTPLNDAQLEELDADRDWLYNRLMDYLY